MLVYEAVKSCADDYVGDYLCEVRPGRGLGAGCGLFVDGRLYGEKGAPAPEPVDACALWRSCLCL